MRRDTRASSTSHQLPPYSSRSPTMSHYHGYSPQNGSMQHQRYDSAYASRPSSSAAMHIPTNVNQSPRLSTPASPTNGLSQPSRSGYSQREPVKTTYYDPTTDHRENSSSWNPHSYNSHSPVHVSLHPSYATPNITEISTYNCPSIVSLLPTTNANRMKYRTTRIIDHQPTHIFLGNNPFQTFILTPRIVMRPALYHRAW